MPKTTKFSELRAGVSPEARAEAWRLADQDLKENPLHKQRTPPDTETTRAGRDMTHDMAQEGAGYDAGGGLTTDGAWMSASARLRTSLKRWAGGWKCLIGNHNSSRQRRSWPHGLF